MFHDEEPRRQFDEFRRERCLPLIADERLDRLVDEGKLRVGQRRFAADARRFFGANDNEEGFAQHFTGSGKTGDIVLVALGLIQKALPRLLIVVPSDAARRTVASYFDPASLPHSFLVRRLGMPVEDARILCERTFVYRSHREALRRDAWIVIGTPHLLVSDFQSGVLRPADFTEVVIDEGDVGTAAAADPAPGAWSQLREQLSRAGARILLLSATRHRSDGRPVPGKLFSRYSYGEALGDGVLKSIRVAYLIPTHVTVDGRLVPDLRDLNAEERRAARESEACLKAIVHRALDEWIAFRASSGIPWILHVVVPPARHGAGRSFRDVVLRVIQEDLRSRRCPVVDRPLHCAGVFGDSPGAAAVLDHLARTCGSDIDVLASCRKLGRAFDCPMIGAALVLHSFGRHSRDALVQAVIGRCVRRLDPDDVRRRHRFVNFFVHRLQEPARCLILEHELNGNRPHYAAFAMEEQRRRPASAVIEEERIEVQVEDHAAIYEELERRLMEIEQVATEENAQEAEEEEEEAGVEDTMPLPPDPPLPPPSCVLGEIRVLSTDNDGGGFFRHDQQPCDDWNAGVAKLELLVAEEAARLSAAKVVKGDDVAWMVRLMRRCVARYAPGRAPPPWIDRKRLASAIVREQATRDHLFLDHWRMGSALFVFRVDLLLAAVARLPVPLLEERLDDSGRPQVRLLA